MLRSGTRVGMLLASVALPFGAAPFVATPAHAAPARPQGSCDIYAAGGAPCVAAHSSTRALYASYNGPLYQVMRQSDGKTLDIGVVQPSGQDHGGYANAAAQDAFCADTICWITILYDQSGHKNDLVQAPRGGFSGPSLGGFNNLPVADMAPVTVQGHKVYGVYIAPGMGLRQNDAKGIAVDDQSEGQYWVINGLHYNSGCCFDYGNAETDSRDDGNGTMETTFFGNTMPWYHGTPPGPWIMTDQENNLVGCVNPDKSKLCRDLPNIKWRFVTAMAKGKPHHWATLGGNSQKGPLKVMFDGPRIDSTYDPMRKQGAILLGNGGDNSHGSQGTFYEGAMTASGTYPSHAVDQRVQANVVAARYDVASVSIAPAAAVGHAPGLQTFTPGGTAETTVTYTNTSGAPVSDVTVSLALPDAQWSAEIKGKRGTAKNFASTLAPDQSVNATFKITSGPVPFNGDLVATASWTGTTGTASETAVEKVRNVSPVKINEFRTTDGSTANPSNAFIELYNAGSAPIDLSNWTLTQHASMQATFSTIAIPTGTRLAAHGYYLLGLANSGLSVPARAGDTTLFVRDVTGLKVGDNLEIGSGTTREIRTIASLGTGVGENTTVWQPLPDGPIITLPVGSTNVPVASADGFQVGEKIALGYGTTHPVVGRDIERYEVATVTAVGKAGTQGYLGMDALPGATNIRVTSVENISPGDRIRLDIDTRGHGIETVTVKSVGTAAHVTQLIGDTAAGATSIKIRRARGFAAGDGITVGTPANREEGVVTAVRENGFFGSTLTLASALIRAHGNGEDVVDPGTGLELAAPLKFMHAANMPFSARGTGISFTPASAFAHSSNEPVLPLGTGVKLDRPLASSHPIDDVVRDAAVATVGYQGSPAPQQWFGGPALAAAGGNMVLRDARDLVVDSLNYGEIVDPWSAEGYQGISGAEKAGCFVVAPGVVRGWPPVSTVSTNSSAGRFPDGYDTDSNCTDMMAQSATVLPNGADAGSRVLKVVEVTDFAPGQSILVGSGSDIEHATIASVGTPGATRSIADTNAGTSKLIVANGREFTVGQTISVDTGANEEQAAIVSINRGRSGARITLKAPFARAHGSGAQVSGSGIQLTAPLEKAHAAGEQIASDLPTPGAPNHYSRARPAM